MHKLLLVTLGFNITLLQTTLTESKLLLGPKVNSNQPTRSRNVLSTMGYQEATSPGPHLWNLQSEAMCPAPPHLVHTVVLVMLRVSELCQGLKILSWKRGRKKSHQGLWPSFLLPQVLQVFTLSTPNQSHTYYHLPEGSHSSEPTPEAASSVDHSGPQGSQYPASGCFLSSGDAMGSYIKHWDYH